MFDLKCLFPEVGEGSFATFDDSVCSEIQGDSEWGQSWNDGWSDEEGRNVQ